MRQKRLLQKVLVMGLDKLLASLEQVWVAGCLHCVHLLCLLDYLEGEGKGRSASFRNFLQIFRNRFWLPSLRACWCLLLSMCNHTTSHNYCRTRIINGVQSVPHGHAAMCVCPCATVI